MLMLAAGIASLMAGAALAYKGKGRAAKRRLFERCGGFMLVTGLALIGAAAFLP